MQILDQVVEQPEKHGAIHTGRVGVALWQQVSRDHPALVCLDWFPK